MSGCLLKIRLPSEGSLPSFKKFTAPGRGDEVLLVCEKVAPGGPKLKEIL